MGGGRLREGTSQAPEGKGLSKLSPTVTGRSEEIRKKKIISTTKEFFLKRKERNKAPR
jgi:hypothetical protein